MRRLLVDYARAREAEKRGGQLVRVDIEHADRGAAGPLRGSDRHRRSARSQLAESDPRMAQIVELRFFGGLTNPEIGESARHQRADGEAGLADGAGVALQPARRDGDT